MKKYYSNYEKKYSIKEILKLLLRKVGIIIACAALFAVGLWAMKSISQIQQETGTQNSTELKNNFDDDEELQISKYLLMVKILEEEEKKLEESIAYNLNPYRVAMSYNQYYVSAEYEKNYDVLVALSTYVESGALAKDVEEELYIGDAIYIDELISLENNIVTGEKQPNVFEIKVYGEDEVFCETLVTAIDSALKNYANSLDGIIANNELVQISSNVVVGTDLSLKDWQTQKETTVTTLETDTSAIYEKLSVDQKKYVDNQLSENGEYEEIKDEIIEEETSNVKTIVMGAMLGVLVAVAIILLLYIFSSTMKTEGEIQECFDILLLGHLPMERKNKWNCFVERLVEGKDIFDTDVAVEKICNNIFAACKKDHIEKVAVVADKVFGFEKYLTEFRNKMTDKKIEFVVVNDLYSALQKFDNLILVESKGKSKCKCIMNEINICKAQNACVLGYIVMM